MAELKTKKTKASVTSFINSIEDAKLRKECKAVASLLKRVTGEAPAMYGTSMVGFGTYSYQSGKNNVEWFITGFSPRKQNLTIYSVAGFERSAGLMKKLGKHKTGRSCLYVKSIEDIDLDVLEKVIAEGVAYMRARK